MLFASFRRRLVPMSKHQSGQAQILAVLGLGAVVISLSTTAFEQLTNRSKIALEETWRVKSRQVLDRGTQIAHALYTEAGCVPHRTQDQLNHIRPDGTINSNQIEHRYLQIDSWVLSFGPLESVDPLESSIASDAWLEINTTQGSIRVTQRLILINTCTTPCSAAGGIQSSDGICIGTAPSRSAYARIPTNNTQRWRTSPSGCTSPHEFGDYNADHIVDANDLFEIRNAWREGQAMEDVPLSCLDANQDGELTGRDELLWIKHLRGYLRVLPIHSSP